MKATNLVYNVLFATIFQKRETLNNLAPLLWYSFGTIAALLQVCSNPCPLLCLLIVWASLNRSFEPTLSFYVIMIGLLGQSLLIQSLSSWLSVLLIYVLELQINILLNCQSAFWSHFVCLSTWKHRKLCQSTLHFHPQHYQQVQRTEPAMHLHFFRYGFRVKWG